MTTEQVKLKPCPMGCAGDVIGGEHEGASVYCKVCWLRAVSPEAWNTRIDPPSPDAGERREAIARIVKGARLSSAFGREFRAGDGRLDDVDLDAADAILALPPAPDADTAKLLREALELARPIVEADLAQSTEYADADWEGMSRTALEAIDAALQTKDTPSHGG